MVLEWLDFIYIKRNANWGLNQNLGIDSLDILFSMLTTEFVTGNPPPALDDVNSLEYKKSFDGPFHWRLEGSLLEHDFGTGTPAGSNFIIHSDKIPYGPRTLRYVPPIPLDLVTPLVITLINSSRLYTTVDLITEGANPQISAANLEFLAIRPWYSKRTRRKDEMIGVDEKGAKKFLNLGA